ncbi:MAG TPA: DoxX family protein, partial [Myxococcota bacterium]|nr:DoxX family protein [Myxococcota bacterium]
MGAYHVANIVSILAFGTYGLLVLFADGMVEEFERFGLSRFRRLTGSLEVLGALGLAVGYLVPALTLLASAGL